MSSGLDKPGLAAGETNEREQKGGFSYPKTLRLRRGSDFKRVYETGQKQVGRHFVLWVLPNELPHFRAGTVASKRVGNAVKRGRAKRRIRELVRTHQHELQPGWDLVFVARYSLPGAPWDRVLKDFEHVCKRAGIQQNPDRPIPPPGETTGC